MRRLILFAFAGGKQDYEFWINDVPYFAKKYGPVAKPASDDPLLEDEELETEQEAAAPSYTIENITDEGCFLTAHVLTQILSRVQAKKNLVLQGPPGTGKTWLAKRLAYALIGSKDPKVARDRLRIVQFHPSLSYEDFVRGWRPSAAGKLELVDGIFLEVVEAANAAHEVHAAIGSDPQYGLTLYTRVSRTIYELLGPPGWQRRRMADALGW